MHLCLLSSLPSSWYAIQQWNKTFKEHTLRITFRELWIHFINRSLCCLNRLFSARFSSIVLTHARHCRRAMAHALQFPPSFGLNKSGFSASKMGLRFKNKTAERWKRLLRRIAAPGSIGRLFQRGSVQFHGAKYDANVLFCPINGLLHSFISMREKGKVHLGSRKKLNPLMTTGTWSSGKLFSTKTKSIICRFSFCGDHARFSVIELLFSR